MTDEADTINHRNETIEGDLKMKLKSSNDPRFRKAMESSIKALHEVPVKTHEDNA